MAKVNEEAAVAELPLNNERAPEPEVKRSRDENTALTALTRQRAKLLAKRTVLNKAIERIDSAILALELE